MLSPGKIGGIAQAALVLVQFEHKMITYESLRQASACFVLGGCALG
jgi:hypothetical protein